MASRLYKVGNRFYDTGTSNKTFIQYALDLKKRGIKNWYFCLEICDPNVILIDPYAEDNDGHSTLTKDQITRITMEITRNPWYFLREISRIPSSGLLHGIPYIANRGNMAQAWCLLHGIDSWLVLPRQQGKTKSALTIQDWGYNWGTSNSTFIFINKDGDGTKMNLRDLAEMNRLLPEPLRYESFVDENGKTIKQVENATRMWHPVTHNQIVVRAKATGYDAALGMGRGLTAPVIHFDECEFTNWIDVIVGNSVSTYETASRKAKEAGTLYGRIFTSTPGDPDTAAGAAAEKLLDNTLEWDEHFFDEDPEYIKELSMANKKNGIVYIEYSYQQIGLTEDWFRKIAAKIGDPITVRREILLQRLRGSSASPYDRDDIERIIELEREPIDSIMLRKYYKLLIYEKLNKGIPYLVGIDCSTGNGGDANAMTIIDPYTTMVVAEFNCCYIGEPEFERLIIELVTKHLPRAILCIERNSIGDGIIKHLLETRIAGRIYFDKFKELSEDAMKELETSAESILKARAQQKQHYGVYTSTKSREVMFTILADRVHSHKEKFVGKYLIKDITKLVRKGTKIQAADGFHDDNVMSYLIGMFVRFYGNNLEVFGFSEGDSFLIDENRGKGLTIDQLQETNAQNTTDSVQQFVDAELRRRNTATYEDILRRDMMRAQERERQLNDHGLVESKTYANTAVNIDGGYLEDDDNSLDFLDELNDYETFV